MGNKKKKSSKGQSRYKCELCDDRDKSKPIVACDVCDKWHHFSCVNIELISKKDPWICEKCKPPTAKEATGTPSTYSCELCRHADNNEMLQCNECQQKYHFVCVELDLDKLPKPFVCMKCYIQQSQQSPSKGHQFSVHSRPASVHQLSYSQTSRQKTQLQLEYLEEQRKFHERWNRERELQEQEYLQNKYKVLKENVDLEMTTNLSYRKQYNENRIGSVSQHQLDHDLKNQKRQAEGSFDKVNFVERLERLKNDSTSSLKPHNVQIRGSLVQSNQFEQTKRTNSTKHDHDANFNTNDQPDQQEQTFNFSTHSNSSKKDNIGHKVNDKPDYSKFRQQDEKFDFGKRFSLPKDDNKVNDPLDHTKFRQMVNPQAPLPDADSHLKSTGQQVYTLTKAQIASRQVVKYKLHNFYGDPLEWTSWYCDYESTTSMCGYTNAENLHRLKECLKGKAESAVKHRLLSPLEVPNVIKTLKLLFGRPEQIVNVLLKTVKEIQPPKADRLETLVDYAMEVNSVSATIESANLHYHLSNPTLIHELVEKLPVHTKIDWAKYKANRPNTTLKMLAEWLYDLAAVVCTVTDQSSSRPENRFDKKAKKGFERVNVHQFENYISKSSNSSGNNNSSHVNSRQSSQCKICNGKCSEISKCPTFKSYDIKRKWDAVNKNKLCRKCLRLHNGYCRQTKECGINGCVFKHHPTLHSERQLQQYESPKTKENSNGAETAVVSNNFHNASVPNILFRIVPVTLYNGEIVIKTYAYLDEGSSATLIEEDLAKELQTIGFPERLCLLWTSNVHRIEAQSHRMNVVISGQNEFSARYEINGVRTVKDLGLPSQTINQQELVKRFSYLKGIPLISYTNEMPRILIGLPHARICTQLTSIEGTENQPIASKSRIGWSLHGPTRELTENYVQRVNEHRVIVCEQRQHKNDDELHRLVKDHFSLENFGVNINTEFNLNSKENQRALDILDKSTKRVNERFETALLWRYDNFELEDSYTMAKRRLICLEKSKKNYIQTIDATINDYIAKGYVTKLTSEDLSITRSKVGYLPIFIVVNPKKPDKLRMVFDAAAKTKGISLNDMLLKGPDQLNSLVDILRRFREHIIAICGDISEMYHQILICEEDRHVQRFLWRNGNTDKEPDVYVLNVMTFGAKCSPSSAQFIKNKNAEEFREELPKAVDAIVSNTYVDDMMDGAETDDKVIQLVNDVQRIHNHGGFKIGKFLSNSTKVLEALGEPKNSEMKQLDMDPIQHLERVLGMFWNTTTDCFMFSLKYTKINEEVISGKRYPTKREILQTLMSIFDPLGLLQHFLVRLKILLQKIWRSKLKWDDQLVSDDHKEMWDSWFKILPEVENIAIPRLYSPNLSSSTVDLHIFVDASEDAYTAVAFLRIENQQQVKCVLVGSKSRVVPIKYVSIPRLELQAGVLGTRLMKSIEKSQNFKLNRRIIWSDSSTVISWLRSDHKNYQQFVGHRIGEILENSDLEMWRWIPGKINVADDATKWEKPPSFEQNCRWFNGPPFLYQPEENWPKEMKPIEADTPEEMKIRCLYIRLMPARIIDPTRFSNWNRMVRALAYVFHYTRILRAKIYKEKLPERVLSQNELIKSRNIILRQAQFEGYPDEMVILIRNQSLPEKRQRTIPNSSSIISCLPYLDENGLLRVRGRTDAATEISIEQKRPIILPKMNKITSLLVGCYHRIYLHRNHETVVNEIKQQFYIPQLRVILKMVRKNCQRCKITSARPQAPEMGNLPFARLAVGFRPFTYTGIDYFGPIKIVDGRVPKKRWGIIFTCLTVRAVHIEIAHSMDTESCILGIRNFIIRYGAPKEIYSDNGTNLVGADNELSDAVEDLDQEKLASTFTTCYTEWKYNPPATPHQGGVWERLVQSIKTCLYSIMPKDHMPTDEQLKNLLAESQFVVNSRPLTFISLEHETDEALTSNHFLFGTSDGSKPIVPPTDRRDLRSKWRENQRLTDLFWVRFVKEYLPTLTRRTKWFSQVEPLKVGDLVLMMDEEGPRNSYPRAKIIEVVPGSNNQVRRVRVQRHDKVILVRSAHKLAKLDVEPPQDRFAVQPESRINKTGGSVVGGSSAK